MRNKIAGAGLNVNSNKPPKTEEKKKKVGKFGDKETKQLGSENKLNTEFKQAPQKKKLTDEVVVKQMNALRKNSGFFNAANNIMKEIGVFHEKFDAIYNFLEKNKEKWEELKTGDQKDFFKKSEENLKKLEKYKNIGSVFFNQLNSKEKTPNDKVNDGVSKIKIEDVKELIETIKGPILFVKNKIKLETVQTKDMARISKKDFAAINKNIESLEKIMKSLDLKKLEQELNELKSKGKYAFGEGGAKVAIAIILGILAFGALAAVITLGVLVSPVIFTALTVPVFAAALSIFLSVDAKLEANKTNKKLHKLEEFIQALRGLNDFEDLKDPEVFLAKVIENNNSHYTITL